MSKVPTTGILNSTKQAGSHAYDAAKAVAVAGKDAVVNTNSRLAGHIADKGVWGTMKHVAGTKPLLVGAAGVTAAYVVGTKVMGRNEQRVREARMGQEQGQQR